MRYNAPDFNDPFSQMFKPIYECGQSWNWSAYCSPEYDALLARANTTVDPAEIQAIAEEIQRIVVDDAVNIYVAEATQVAGLRKDIKGYYAIAFYPGFAYIYDMYRE
jgi:peptide/nickel transport system substrate-binding protein